MDIAQEMSKMLDEEIERTLFASFGQQKADTREVNPIEDINRMIDRLTTLVFCNPDKQKELQALVDKESGFYKIIGNPYIEKGEVVIIKDENLKLTLLSIYRNIGTTSVPNCGTI